MQNQMSLADWVHRTSRSGDNSATDSRTCRKIGSCGGDADDLARESSAAEAALAPSAKRRRADVVETAVPDEDFIEIVDDEDSSTAAKLSSVAAAAAGATATVQSAGTSSSGDVTASKASAAMGATSGGWAMLGRITARKLDIELEGDAEMHLAPLPPGVSAAALLAHVRSLTLEVEPTFTIRGEPCVMHRCVGFYSDDSGGYKYARQESKAQPLTPELRDLIAAVNAYTGANYNGVLINRYRSGSDYMGAHADDESELGDAMPPAKLTTGTAATHVERGEAVPPAATASAAARAVASTSGSSSSGKSSSSSGSGTTGSARGSHGAVGDAGAATGSAAVSGGAGAAGKPGPGPGRGAAAASFRGVCVSCISLGAERTFRLREKGSKKLVKKGDVRLPHGSLMTMAGADFQRLYTHEIPVEEKMHGERFSLTFRRHLK